MPTRTRLGLREIRALGPGETVWDGSVPGFGARRQKGDAVAYVLLYRTAERRQRWHTIGRHGAPWTPDTARAEARRVLVDVTQGADPAADRKALSKLITVAELCDRYWADVSAGRVLVRGGRPKKPSTLASDRGRIEGHIKPLLGRLPVTAVAREDVNRFMHAIAAGETAQSRRTKPRGRSILRGGRGVATRSVGLLGAIMSYAVEQGLRPDNPAHRIRKFAEGKRERRLSDDEYRLLGEAIRQAEARSMWPPALAALRFLCLTGWRRGEVLGLKWSEVDLVTRTARLPDTKTGASMRPLAHAACAVLGNLPRSGRLVFPASKGETGMTGFFKICRRIVALGHLAPDITPHILRHSFASLAGDLGHSEATIAALVGHKGQSVTSRYIHSADAVLLAAADAVASETARRMGEATAGCEVVQLRG